MQHDTGAFAEEQKRRNKSLAAMRALCHSVGVEAYATPWTWKPMEGPTGSEQLVSLTSGRRIAFWRGV